jgi:hypothetical protein
VLHNRGIANQQIGALAGIALGGSSIDTTVNQNLLYTGTLAVATDWLVMEAAFTQLMPG